MNTVTKAEVHATEAGALEVADPSKNLIFVPLSQLRPSPRNVRKTNPKLSIPELAASIQHVGLVQNLVVTKPEEGGHYEVEAGGRRLAALKLLAKKKRIPADHPVACLLVADGSARTVSLTENVQREAMHGADQFEAFAALVKEGRPIEDIAAGFGVSPLVVQRRLKLANVSPRLLADYRRDDDTVSLEQLMALAITDDHEAQEAAFYNAPEWQRSASLLRERLTARQIAASDPLARFVGLDAYEAAGGGSFRDLFADEDSIYLNDAALLHRLAQDKLAALAEEVRAEGWAWVEAVTRLTHADRQAFRDAPQQMREPNGSEVRRIASLQRRIAALDAALEAAYEAEDEEKVEVLEERQEPLAAALQGLEDSLREYAPDVRAVAGAIVTLDREGEVTIHRGLLREAEAKALRTLERLRGKRAVDEAGRDDDEGDDEDDAAREGAGLSDKLARRLSAHRTAALQIETARHPQIALAALVHGMVQKVLQDGYAPELPLGVRLTVQDRLDQPAPDWPDSPAAIALRDLKQQWADQLPQDAGELLGALLALSQDELLRLLALCVACTVDVVTVRATKHEPGAELAQAVGLDMAAWWRPTAESYFRHVSKAVILEAVAQFAPEHVNRLAKVKKADLVSEAERLVAGTGWMPAIFASTGTEAVASEDATEPASTARVRQAETEGAALAA